MSRNSMPVLIPGVLYKWISKPSSNPNTGERIPDGYTTILAKFVRTDGSDYFWIMRHLKTGDFNVGYDTDNAIEFNINKEQLSKTFFVSEADRTGGKRKRKSKRRDKKSKKSRKNKKSRKYN